MGDLSDAVDRLLPFARAVIAASMELEKYEPLEAALEERLAWLNDAVAKAEAQRTAATDQVAEVKQELARAKDAVRAAEQAAKDIVAGAERQAAGLVAEAERQSANVKDIEARRRQRLHDELDEKIDKLQNQFVELDRKVQDKRAEHASIATELQALKAKFG